MNASRLILFLLLIACARPSASTPPPKAAPARVSAPPVQVTGERVPIDARHAFVLANVESARALITRHDAFIAAMSPLDRKVRTGREDVANDAELFAHFAAQVRPFGTEQVARMAAAAQVIARGLAREQLDLDLASDIPVVLTTGLEEAGASVGVAYTREGVVYLNEAALEEAPSYLLSHELFHVYGHHHPDRRETLYAAIGFVPLGAAVRWPASVEARRVSNPDSPRAEHAIRVRYQGREVLAAYVCLADDSFTGENLFERVSSYYAVLPLEGPERVHPPEGVELANYHLFENFFEQVGYNTGFLAGPEEILADNFEMLIEHPERARTPQLLARLREVMVRR